MKKQTQNQKGFSPLGAIVLIGIVVVVLVLVLSAQNRSTRTTTGTQSVPAIQNTNDLSAVNSELDKNDPGAFDKEFNQLDADASTF